MINRISSIAVTITLGVSGTVFADPSFDCSKAESDAEQAVCNSEALAELDLEVARLYGLALNGPNSGDRTNNLKAMQRGWIKGRDECWKAEIGIEPCVAFSYASRIHELRQIHADARSDDESGVSLGPFAYSCDGLDAGLAATFINTDEPLVVLQWRENEVVLPRVVSASGARYQSDLWFGGPSLFWSKGEDAAFMPPGQLELTCVQDDTG